MFGTLDWTEKHLVIIIIRLSYVILLSSCIKRVMNGCFEFKFTIRIKENCFFLEKKNLPGYPFGTKHRQWSKQPWTACL